MSAQKEVTKRQMEISKLKKALDKAETEEERTKAKRAQTVDKLEDTLQRIRKKKSDTELALELKVAESGEAQGRLEHIEILQSLLAEAPLAMSKEALEQGLHHHM